MWKNEQVKEEKNYDIGKMMEKKQTTWPLVTL